MNKTTDQQPTPTEWHGLTFTEDQFARTHADYVRRLFTGEMNSKEFFEAVYAETRNLLYIHRGTAIAGWVMQGIARTGKIPGHDGDLSNLKPSDNERLDMPPSVLKSFDRPPVDSRTGIVTVGQLRKLCDQWDDADEVTIALAPMDKAMVTAMKVPGGMRLLTLDMLNEVPKATPENQSARPPEVTQARPKPAIHDPHPEPETEGYCRSCGERILKVQGVWQHKDTFPRHIAEPVQINGTAKCRCGAEIFWGGIRWAHTTHGNTVTAHDVSPESWHQKPVPASELKTEGTCKGCGQLILKVAGAWQHSDTRARNHIAEPLTDCDTATCKLCNAEIFWNGLHWDHSPASSPSEHTKRTHDPKPETWA